MPPPPGGWPIGVAGGDGSSVSAVAGDSPSADGDVEVKNTIPKRPIEIECENEYIRLRTKYKNGMIPVMKEGDEVDKDLKEALMEVSAFILKCGALGYYLISSNTPGFQELVDQQLFDKYRAEKLQARNGQKLTPTPEKDPSCKTIVQLLTYLLNVNYGVTMTIMNLDAVLDAPYPAPLDHVELAQSEQVQRSKAMLGATIAYVTLRQLLDLLRKKCGGNVEDRGDGFLRVFLSEQVLNPSQ